MATAIPAPPPFDHRLLAAAPELATLALLETALTVCSPGPLSAIRSFFQLPEQELFLNVSLPAVPGGWSDLSIRLELDESFPAELGVTTETFQLGVVPCVNLWADFAQPLEHDGTRAAHPLRSSSGAHLLRSSEAMLKGVELHECAGSIGAGSTG